jgi:LysR family transcriptional regulator for bpeEF and oprC
MSICVVTATTADYLTRENSMDRVLHAMSVFTHVARTGSFTAALVECHAEYSGVDLRIDLGGRPEGLIDNGVDGAIVVGKLADSSLRSRRIGSFQRICIGDVEAVIYYSARGFGIAQVCGYMSASARRMGSLVEILYKHRPPPLPVTALYFDHRHAPMSVRTFIDWVSARMQGVGAVHPMSTMREAGINRSLVSSWHPAAAAIGDVSPIHAA